MARLVHLALLLAALCRLGRGCGFPGSPAHSTVTFSTDTIGVGTVATYTCDRGFELLGPSRKECHVDNAWVPAGIPFCVINVAAGKAPMQSSTVQGGIPQKAVDGSTSGFFNPKTCTLTEQETSPLWYVNLLEPYMVQLVRLDFGRSCCDNNVPATVVVRVGNNRPDLKINPICNRFTGFMEEGRPLFLPCNPPMPGAFISVHLEGPPGQMLSICEAFVYTDQALPIERCPQFRDQPPGSTATYNGRCYTFYNQQPQNFAEAQQFCADRGGTLIDETNPALQGFLSWELWRRHREDPNGQYWMGAVRDPQNEQNWKWITGQDLGVSFWSLPGGPENCARFDGTKDWLWSDTNCQLRLNFICQHRPLTCGKPEQPPNSTLTAPDFNVGSRIAYRCEEGHLLSGPEERECLSTGFYSAYPPTCKNLQCGMPANIRHGRYTLANNTRRYMDMVVYECDEDFVMVGRDELICDVDERWSGPPPRCEPVFCKEPPPILNGGFRTSTNSTIVGTLVEYYCLDDRFTLSGARTVRCMRDGSYNQQPPVCRAGDAVVVAGGPAVVTFGRPEENEVPDTVNIRQNAPGVSEPDNTLDERSTGPKLHMGGIIALSVFGGFVFLAAVVTTIVILIRRNRSYRQRRSHGRNANSSSCSTESETHGLNKYYKRAWENLQSSGRRERKASTGGGKSRGEPTMRSEMYRDASELTVADVAHVYHGDDKRRHHHHHHRHHHKDERDRADRPARK